MFKPLRTEAEHDFTVTVRVSHGLPTLPTMIYTCSCLLEYFVGFLVSLLSILAPYLAAMIGLVAFLHWQTTLVFLAGLGVICFAAVRLHEKHHRSEAYDDRLTDERMWEATEELVRRWKKD